MVFIDFSCVQWRCLFHSSGFNKIDFHSWDRNQNAFPVCSVCDVRAIEHAWMRLCDQHNSVILRTTVAVTRFDLGINHANLPKFSPDHFDPVRRKHHLTMSDTSSNGSNVSISMVIVIVWVLGGILFVLLPCLINRYQRELWWKRLRNCSWSVEVEPEPEAAWLTRARARYEEQQWVYTCCRLDSSTNDHGSWSAFAYECFLAFSPCVIVCRLFMWHTVMRASTVENTLNLVIS